MKVRILPGPPNLFCVFRGKPNSIPGLVERSVKCTASPERLLAAPAINHRNKARKPTTTRVVYQRWHQPVGLFGRIPECCSASPECALSAKTDVHPNNLR